MSGFQEYGDKERIPSYEESIATSPSRPSIQDKSSQRPNLQQRIKQERFRRIATLVGEAIEPCISRGLEDGLSQMSIVLLPSDIFSTEVRVTEASIVNPTLHFHTNLLRLTGDENRSTFLQQQVVVQELSTAIHNALADPSLTQPEAQAALFSQSIPIADLPARPRQKSWLNRTFGLPPADHDPTGSTGNWNLGWRSEDEMAATHRTVTVDEVAISTRLQEVSFRTESELGLLESKSVKCLWVDIELAT